MPEPVENHHYKYCRDLGQLGPVRAVAVVDGRKRYEEKMLALGMRAGDIKPTHLDTRPIWRDVFSS